MRRTGIFAPNPRSTARSGSSWPAAGEETSDHDLLLMATPSQGFPGADQIGMLGFGPLIAALDATPPANR